MNWKFAALRVSRNSVLLEGDNQIIASENLLSVLSTYTVDLSGQHSIDGVSVTQSPYDTATQSAIIHKDNTPLSRFRTPEFNSDSVVLIPGGEIADDGLADYYAIPGCWPETLVFDLQADPKPEWLEGIEIFNLP